MMINLTEFLGILLYVSLIVLVIICIILGINLIKTFKKVDKVIDDVDGKMKKVNGVFDIIDKTTDYASSISDKIIGTIANFVGTLLRKKKGNDEDE